MTSTTKIHGMANTRELLRTFYAIRNDLISYEARDPITKQTYPIPSFLKMCLLHVPTKAEMNGKGMRKKNWKIPHFLPTADYFIEHAGFHRESCQATKNGANTDMIHSPSMSTFSEKSIGGQRDVNLCKPCKPFFTQKSDILRLNQEGGARNKLVKISCSHGALC